MDLTGKSPAFESHRGEHINGLRNVPSLLKTVRISATIVVVCSIILKLLAGLAPLAILGVTRAIIDSIYKFTSQHIALPSMFWWLVAFEFALATLAMISGRPRSDPSMAVSCHARRQVPCRRLRWFAQLPLVPAGHAESSLPGPRN